jgi:hypothetical protein
VWKRIVPVTVASALLAAGSWAVGWIAAHAEYCQYGNHISVEKCNAYELATLVVDTITWSADVTLPLITFIAAVAACLLTCSLHECNRSLKRVAVARGARRSGCFTPVQQATNIGLWTSQSGSESEMIAHDAKATRARVVANSVALLELLRSDVMVSNGCSASSQMPVTRAVRYAEQWSGRFDRLRHLARDCVGQATVGA